MTKNKKTGTELTKAQEETYLKNPHKCPFCKSPQIQSGSIQVDNACAWQEVECLDCDMEWNDLYALTGIGEKE